MLQPRQRLAPSAATRLIALARWGWRSSAALLLAAAAPVAWGQQGSWQVMPGPPGPGLKQVAVVNKQLVYGLDNDGALWSWNGSGWSRKGCCVSQIAVGSDGDLWATNPPDQMRVLRWNGTQWTWNLPTGMKQVAVANASTIYALDNSGAMFRFKGGNWARQGCCVSHISVGSDGEVWATNPPDQMRVLRWQP